MKYFPKTSRIKRGNYKRYIVWGLLLILVTMLMYPLFSNRLREGLSTNTTDISLNIVITDTTKILSDPNPIGSFKVYTSIAGSESDITKLIIPYPTYTNGSVNTTIPFDTSAFTMLKIEPAKDLSNNKDIHKANMFPLTCKIDITMDGNGPIYQFLPDNTNNIKENSVSQSTDLTGNEITIVKNGPILDSNSVEIGTAYRGDANPINPTSKNQYIFNVVLKQISDLSLSRINLQYGVPPPPPTQIPATPKPKMPDIFGLPQKTT